MLTKTSPETGPQKVEIFPAKPSDALVIREIQKAGWLKTYPNVEAGITTNDIEDRFKDTYDSEKIKEREARIENLSPEERMYVAKIDNKIVGFCVIFKNQEKNQLKAIYVNPEFQGKGLGNKLWKKAWEFCDPSRDTFVEVAEYNQKAIDFYTKLGFTPTGKKMTDERFRMKSGAIIPEIEMVLKAKK